MITVFGGQTSRSLRVVWLLEEMGLPCRVRQVDMVAEIPDAGLLAVNPADYIPELQNGEVTMVESIAITPDEAETAYLARTMGRGAYRRALDASMVGVDT
jgi:glutathione S-transferase